MKRRVNVRKATSTGLIYFIIILFALFVIVPLLIMVFMTFRPQNDFSLNPFSIPKNPTLSNLVDAWVVGHMNRYFLNSVIIIIPRVAGILFLASLAGYGFAKLKFCGNKIIFIFILIGMMMPIQAMMIPLYYYLLKFHILNTYWALILPSWGICMPFAVFFMRSFFMDLPNELIESAKIDGCNEYLTFWSIMLPLAKPGVFTLLIFQFIWGWNDFFLSLLFITEDSLRPIPVALMYFSNRYSVNQTLVAAGVTITTVPIIITYIIFQRRFIEGITAGAIKG